MTASTGRWPVTRIRVTALAWALVLVGGAVSIAASPGPVLQPIPASEFEFVRTGSLAHGRINHTATLLVDGRVLVIGGYDSPTAEIWDPVTDEWALAGIMATSREGHTARLLQDGRVLVVGGEREDGEVQPEVWDPVTKAFSAVDPLTEQDPAQVAPPPTSDSRARRGASQTLLLDGRILVAGGRAARVPETGRGPSGPIVDAAEIWDPATGQSTPTASMTVPRTEHTATLLPDGRVLLVGSHAHGSEDGTAELFQPR